MPLPNATLDDIDEAAIQSFVKQSIRKQRISESASRADTWTILKNLELVNDRGELLVAALLLLASAHSIFQLWLNIG